MYQSRKRAYLWGFVSYKTHLTTGTFTSDLPSTSFNFRNPGHEIVPRTGLWSEKPVYSRILIFSTRHVGGRLIYAGQWPGDDEITEYHHHNSQGCLHICMSARAGF
ncbi:hypothetical protein FVEG_15568 [Fusarium verticillioides 7600]|uniref:Uncharacterized protein n=1 Tax=Gibberella moniliformis (strain M3125 / FGSC 7600) TaxID=334819 RepID=W7MFC6_GIBM7|nr:hypothetical protein FVEG_15568 [Fusarium verticillioides 7600]EWG43447.1 hypothetical protein FVEG_15568 [Fusarium verticillioides 7600]